jgi:hypothetical protein
VSDEEKKTVDGVQEVSAGDAGNSSAVSSNGAESDKSDKGAPVPRKNIFEISVETISYIEKAERDKTIHYRNRDKTSTIFLFLALLCAAMFAFVLVISPENRYLCVALALISDFLFGMAILWYVLLRFGVLRTIEPRYALICWQLMLGAGVLFAFYTMNIAFFFFTLYRTMPGGAPSTF